MPVNNHNLYHALMNDNPMNWYEYPIVFGCYKGKSLFPSRLIRWFSWSDYSHVAGYLRDRKGKQIIESWPYGGVQAVDGWLTNHKAGTHIDLFTFMLQPQPDRLAAASKWMEAQLGKKYDWKGVFRFIIRAGGELDEDWFCSELWSQFAVLAGEPLSYKPAYKMMPVDVAVSARLLYLGEYRV